MTADADSAGHSEAASPPVDAEDYPETAAGASHGAGDAATELVPPTTVADPAHAWSREEPVTEALSRPWRSVWVIAGMGLLCAVVVAFAIFGIVALVRENPPKSPTTPTHSSSAPAPGSSAPPQAARPDDDEFVAIAISPRAIGTIHIGGFGTSGTQDRANQIALSECRAITGNDDCLLVNAGMFHGCVSYATDISQHTWASGSGVDSDSARANALSRLGTPAFSVSVQCSVPPGILRSGSPAAPPATPSAELRMSNLPGTDDLGWTAYPDARCHAGNQPAVMARTTHSVLVVCQIQPGTYYYRGVRLSDGAGIELANAVRSSDGFDVTNPTDGTRYQIRPTSLTIAPPDAQASSEPMLEYASS
jgi:hypothetical protein